MYNSRAIELLKKHEGFRARIYYCSERKRTIGYGYNIDANPLHLTIFELDRLARNGISEKTAENFLIDMVYKIKFALDKEIPWWSGIGQPRRDVLINMAYNLGVDGLLKFKNTLQMIKNNDYEKASEEMLKSKWASQVGNRAEELSKIMLRGKYSDG